MHDIELFLNGQSEGDRPPTSVANTMKTNGSLLVNQQSLHVTILDSAEYLPPANEVCEGYVFTGVCLSTGGACVVYSGGVCMVLFGGHVCVVLFGGRV